MPLRDSLIRLLIDVDVGVGKGENFRNIAGSLQTDGYLIPAIQRMK